MREIEDDGVPAARAGNKLPWVAPALTELPKLTELTLQSTIPGAGLIGGGGSTVF